MYFKQFIYKCLCCSKLFLRGEFRGIRGPTMGSMDRCQPVIKCIPCRFLPHAIRLCCCSRVGDLLESTACLGQCIAGLVGDAKSS